MRAKRLQTRQQNEPPSAAKKSRQKTLPVKRGASSSRDTSPPKSVRKVQDKVDAHKKTVTKVVPKPKKDTATNESKPPANKDDTKASQPTVASQQSSNDSAKANKKVAKNVVEEPKKKDVAKPSGTKIKSPVKKDTGKQGIKKVDEKPSTSKDEKVSKELKNLGIDQSPSSNDKTIKASISEIVKTKSRTSASQSLYGKSAIGVDKASVSKSNEHGKDGGKETITKTDADEKKDVKPEMKDEKDVKPTIKPIKKESSKDCKKEKGAGDAETANAAEKKQPTTTKSQSKKICVENKEPSTKSSDSKTKAGQVDDKKEADVKKPITQDISKDNAKKLKKTDGNAEQKKKSKKSETEPEQDQSKQASKATVKVDAKKSKAPKVTKSKKETEKESDKDNKAKDGKGPSQNIEKLDGPSNKELSKDVIKCESKEESKASGLTVENKQPSTSIKKSKSDNNGPIKKSENDAESPSTKTSDEDANKKPPKKDNVDSRPLAADATVKQAKKKNKSPKKSAIVEPNEPKDLSKPKESRESSLASIAQTIEDVIAQAMSESVSLESPKVESDNIAKPVKSPKVPKVKKTESGKTDGNAVKRKYVKKKNKNDDQAEATTSSNSSEKVEQAKERKIETSAVNKPSGKADKEGDKEIEKEKKAKKPAAPKKKPKLAVEDTEKTDEDVKLQPPSSDPINSQSENNSIIAKVSTPEASSNVKESVEEPVIDVKPTQLTERTSPSADAANVKFNDDPVPTTESSNSQIESTDCTINYETEPTPTNSKVEEPTTAQSNPIPNLDQADDGTTASERIDNISSLVESPKFISEDSDDDDDDFFINLPANLMSATFSGLNIDKPIKEAHQSGSSVPPSAHIIPASTNAPDNDSNESTTTSSDESIDEKRRKKKPTKVAMKKKKMPEKVVKKKPSVASKPSKASKSTAKAPAKVQPEKQVAAPMKSKISVKSLESMKNPVLEKKIKVEILSDDDACNRFDDNDTSNQPSTSAQQPKDFASIEPPTKRKYVRKKPLKSDHRSKDDDDNNDSSKKDVYDFHESGHSSEDTCLSYKKNAKNDKETEKKKPVPIEKTAAAKKKVTAPKKKIVTKKEDQTDDDQKPKMGKNDEKAKPSSKTAKGKSSQQKRKPSSNHSDSSDSDDDKVLSKKFAKKKKMPTESSGSGSESESESSDCEPRANASTDKNRRKKSMDSIAGPKRHRMASLNALAKVQCLYENESRTAQELGFVKEPRNLPKEKPVVLLTSDDETDKVKAETASQPVPVKKDKETKKEKKVKPMPQETKDEKQSKGSKDEKAESGSDDENEDDEEEEEAVVSRTLRTAPGLRGAGKLWEVSMSSMESNSDVDSDESYEDNKADKTKPKKKPLPKRTIAKPSPKTAAPKSKSKTASKPKIPSKRSVSSDNSDSSDSEPEAPTATSSKKQSKKKRKTSPHDRKSDFKDLVVRKRMASLNASAMLAATYEVERHLDRVDSMYYGSSAESDTLVTPKKIKEIKREIEEPKEPRPVSTNVVIVQDTDVTITGVYVNSSLGSSQEAYCKMQYRVQSSVTEERLVRPGTQDPPKSYTPLSALSCMLPPGSGDSIGIEAQPPTIQHQPPYHHVPPHQMPPLPHHLQSHHQSPDCETPSPFRYQNVYQQSPPTQMQSSSAFCAIPQPDASGGYYQPAGPLINSHLVPQSQPVSTKAGSSGLDGDTVQLQSPSTPGSESTDREVLITGGTPRPQTFHYPPPGHGPYQRPIHQMHCPTYPPANYYAPYSQHPQDMCYSPPYQTYYPPKVYPSSYRRYVTPSGAYYQTPNEMYEPPPPPPTQTQSQQPPSNQQIVPTGPQHIEHYPYYSGYSPGSGPGGCYNRSMQPPFIDSSPYQNSCPCPMQSCPKNVHTGPLIGSKTGKGPVQSNHLVAPIDIATSVTLSSNPTSASQKINCKTEDLSPQPPIVMVKPETDAHLYHHAIPVGEITKSPVRDKAYEKIGHAPPNFALNTKVLEPEMSISPARGSTGLPLPPIQASATQPADNPTMMRKARVGKSMAREMMMMVPQQRQALNLHVDSNDHPRLMAEHTDIIMDVKNDAPLIKKEIVKIECEDDVVILDNSKFETPTKAVVEDRTAALNCDESTSSTDDVEISSKRKSVDSEVITLEDSMEEETLPSSTMKKRKILELHKDPCKKSPPNSYKSLIKQSEPKPYLCSSDVTEKHVSRGRSRYRLIRGRSTPRYRHRKIIINGKHKKVFITNRKVKRRIIKKNVTKKATTANKPAEAVATDVKEVQVNEEMEAKSEAVADECTEEEKTEEKRLFMSSLELTIDGVAKGYFSDQEHLAKSKSSNKLKKGAELRSKSETKRPQIVESIESNVKMRDRSKSATKNAVEPKPAKAKVSEEKSGKSAVKKQTKSSRVTDDTLLDDYSINNNNNTIVMDNNYGKVQRTTTAKKTKSRGAKFSNKKKHRVRQLQEIEDIEIPRKSTAAPRWSNGWHWEGEPFKGKVFLNSDDVQVIRTRYPAMRHDSGDVIQPGDCVLLRAGSKKNELPYVAKVASLWENPEDGEMMMSLLWYYRPEHTEQGRQSNDCPDEVFASKHQDHNSVACIEDKCYVLTFNEYCRYRKALKATEEDIVLPKPIAPCMTVSEDKVPVNTNSELVLFCRRVYEFRLKRLIKNPS